MFSRLVRCCLVLLLASGCATRLGPRSLASVRFDYNEAVATSTDQQMLLNVVRMRYVHSPTFLQLNSVVTQYSLSTDAGVNGSYNPGAAGGPLPDGTVGASGGISVSERPTITYTPLQGAEFVKRVARPMPADSLLLLLQSGWGWDVVMSCCIQRINDLRPPYARSSSDEFDRLAALMHKLQRSYEVSVEEVTEGGPSRLVLVFHKPGGEHSAPAIEAMGLLGIDPVLPYYEVTEVSVNRLPGTIAMQTRSILSAMFYLSQGVEVTDGDAALFGTETLRSSMPVMRVRAAKRAPKNAYVAVEFRGRWYFLAEDDINSKRVFALLTFLFKLMAAPSGQGPVLTVGAGG